jgi:hypothetical protein
MASTVGTRDIKPQKNKGRRKNSMKPALVVSLLPRLASRLFRLLPCALCFLCLPGCAIFGVLAGKVAPPQTIPAQYTGMQDQSVAVMAWAGEGTLIDFPDLRLDLAGSLQTKLQQAKDAKTKELTGVTFPNSAASVVKFQDNHPEYDATPLVDVAPKFNATRVVYVEIEDLQTRSPASVELYRGTASATLKVVEVPAGGGVGKIAYEESGITVIFPPKSREEGSPNGNDFSMYRGTVDALSSEIAKRFVPHSEDQ